MSSTVGYCLPGSDEVKLNLEETELTLALPGETRWRSEISAKSGGKRLFSQTVDINLNAKRLAPPAKKSAVGWPPVRSSRQNAIRRTKLVKVAVDGAPYLRKVDLEVYKSYQQLLSALEHMFSGLAIRNSSNERKAKGPANGDGVEYVPTYEDGDGDWMLVGDMPWKLFLESCKRLRFVKSSEATGSGTSNSTSSS